MYSGKHTAEKAKKVGLQIFFVFWLLWTSNYVLENRPRVWIAHCWYKEKCVFWLTKFLSGDIYTVHEVYMEVSPAVCAHADGTGENGNSDTGN